MLGDDGDAVRTGHAGRAVTRGPNTCVGFFADPERTAAMFSPDGWVRSGDTVTIDGDGYLTVVGRKKEILIRGGMNIAPREIEEVLLGFPEVERAAVVGVPDARLGERACACVVAARRVRPRPRHGRGALRGRRGRRPTSGPSGSRSLDALPSTASGKIQKHVIVADLAARDAS